VSSSNSNNNSNDNRSVGSSSQRWSFLTAVAGLFVIVGCLGKTIQTKMAFIGIYKEMACVIPEDPEKNTIGGAMIQEAQHPLFRYHGAGIFFETTGNLGAKPETQTQRLKGPVEYQA